MQILLLINITQFKDPSFHSWYNPIKRIKIKKIIIKEYWNKFEILNAIIIGSKRVNSTSKIIKITAIRKNCNEKGIRAEFLGSKPHSNGLFFSRSEKVFFEIKFKIRIKINIIHQIKIVR